ncbi:MULTISPECIES: GNAT family N-acetyltransferase [unclassified Schaalia]|uniref:GNAT family N-acetyltransferase n=1 Tax=unclassified Schaalia TaxID=2691889 RepID=UPI001E44FDDB|nr:MULTISPECIES: GNAT family N-acetyltransferase [unclassified Schaalia]MCD4549487.1 GNAT family N-acetyltransferase [Schaalia sp. lx-260]MCD4558048.1 GNAT family N-acetyltransferase [Schaalia sp. lx-100]
MSEASSTGLPPLSVRAGAPETVPFPPSHHGVEWHELTASHVYLLANLFARIEARDNPPFRTSTEEVAEMLNSTVLWRGVAGFATKGMAKGRMVAFAQVTLRNPGHLECVCQGGVDPSFRSIGLGGSLVEWQELTARTLLAENDGVGSAQIVAVVEAGQEDHEQHLQQRGFHWARTYYELRANLNSIPHTSDLGPWLSIEPWAEQWEEPARITANRISEQEWGRPPLTSKQWLMGRTGFVPEWSFVALDRRGDRPRMAGFLMASRYVQDWIALGWREGYIDQMCVDQEYRHSHVLEGLVVASMRAQAANGMERIGVGIGSANHSGALAVYDYLGFRTVGQSRLYAIEI